MPKWLTEAELEARWGAARITRLADRDHDGDRDTGVVDDAIEQAEGRVESALLGGGYVAGDLPTVAADATPTLKRLVGALALYYLTEGREVIGEDVVRIKDDAVAELNRVASGGTRLGLEGAPAVDAPPAEVVVVIGQRDPAPLSLKGLEDW